MGIYPFNLEAPRMPIRYGELPMAAATLSLCSPLAPLCTARVACHEHALPPLRVNSRIHALPSPAMTTPPGWEPRPGSARGEPDRRAPRDAGGWPPDDADPPPQPPPGGDAPPPPRPGPRTPWRPGAPRRAGPRR